MFISLLSRQLRVVSPPSHIQITNDGVGLINRRATMIGSILPFLAAALLAYFSNFFARLRRYGATPGPTYFGANYVTQQK